MTQRQLPPPIMIDEPKALADLVSRLKRQPKVAVDTESNSLHAYPERVCLMQFSTPNADYLVDSLALSDLGLLGEVFADRKVEKIFHAAEYDLMTLKRDFQFKFETLFDTQTACRTLGWKRTGLADLLELEFGVKQNKRHQRANWGQRPLKPELLHYARLDTHYLIPLRDRLAELLKAEGKWEAAREIFQWQTEVAPAENAFDPNGFWKIGQRQNLRPRAMAVLRELYLFRDSQAVRLGRPPFKVMNDQTLAAIAEARPQSAAELSRLPGMTLGQVKRYGEGILAAVRRGNKAHQPRRPRVPRTDDAAQERFEKLHEWRKLLARRQGVESDIVLPREVLRSIAVEAPRTKPELQRLMKPMEWRFRTYGDQILTILKTN